MVIDFGAAKRLIPCPGAQHAYPKQPYVFPADDVTAIVSHHQHFCWIRNDPERSLYGQTYGRRELIAPELLQDSSDGADIFHPMLCEIWTLGIILFMMLSNSSPFYEASGMDYGSDAAVNDAFLSQYEYFLMHGLERLLICFDMEFLQDPLLVDLFVHILQIDPLQRLTIEEILQHPWMQQS
jgi:serine/threonine protein kinase